MTSDGTSAPTVPAPPAALGDGRRARRERSRRAIVDAAFSLILDGKGPATAGAIAERAGVSASSVFRNFDGLEDLQRQAVEQFRERFAHLLLATPPAGADIHERVGFFIRVRLDLFAEANPLMAVPRMRSIDDDSWIEPVNRNRSTLADQTRACFAEDTAGRTPTDAANLVALIDTIASPEAYDLMTGFHARSSRQVAAAWHAGIHALLTVPRQPWCAG